MNRIVPVLLGLGALGASLVAATETIPLSAAINPRDADNEFAAPATDKSTAGAPLRLHGKTFEKGVGVQVETTIFLAVSGATRFTATAGVDDATSTDDGVVFEVQADGQSLWKSGELHRGYDPVPVDLDLRGKKELQLIAVEAGRALSQAHADWADAKFEYEGTAPKSIPFVPTVEAPVILTPKPGPAPRLTGPAIFGARPGHPFLFTVTATGDRPITFAADALPAGLTLETATGRITGTVATPGSYVATLRAINAQGTAERKFRIEVGERISLTPSLGWNSWNCWATAVDQDKILRSARAMVSSGLANHGWSYINIDDAWQGKRSGPLNALQPNEKFPDMKGLADAVHGLGLKLGIYSTPWTTSYAVYAGGSAENPEGAWTKPAGPKTVNRKTMPWAIGRYSFATADARQWAEWGIDYLKYDWNPNEIPETAEMASALRISGRDIVYSLSNAAPMSYVPELSRLANSWRTTGDIRDYWGSVLRIGFFQEKWRAFGGPGHWNDPDMLVVGWVGWGPKLHNTRLTPNEQYTHITLWSLLNSPLLIGCDLERIDDFTLNLLGNDEVIEVNQDPRGEQAAQVLNDGRRQVWAKTMEDGSRAIGFFNLSTRPDTVSIPWSQLGLKKPSRIRDVWRQKDVEVSDDVYSVDLPRHGAALI
ncbi:MAG TPA: NPCBM/NEW2 domain-containing protein, partial [Candidatus Didemnitutus sp.]|nr:NPCBM/NEW2 domain-containing protein [Candidatus Didemnitutus sp.]